MTEPMTPEEIKREWVEAADRVNWLAQVRDRLATKYDDAVWTGDLVYSVLEDANELLAYVDKLRDYLREKNEIIRSYVGPTGMTPEDVAEIRRFAHDLGWLTEPAEVDGQS